MRDTINNERGIAMAICLFVLAALSGLTVAALNMSRADIVTSRNYRGASQGLAAAEAGLDHAVQTINIVGVIDLHADIVNTWSGGAPFGAAALPEKESYSYAVTIDEDPYHATDVNRGVLTSVGTGSDDTLRTVQAFIIKSDIPNAPPGAIYLAADNPTNATFTGTNFQVNGNDQNLDGTAGAGAAVPGITTRTEANAQETRNSLNGGQNNGVTGLGYIPGSPATPSVSAVNGPNPTQINQLITDLLARPGVVTNSSSNIAGNQVFGTEAAPQITYLNNGSGVTMGNGNVDGYGILIVENSLTLNGNLDFKGLVIVRGTTHMTEVTGSAQIWGSLWTTDFNLTVGGHADVQYSSQALAIANLAGGGGALPAPVKIYSWRDVF